MYPIIFQYKFITISSYGLMLGLGFYLAFKLLERELKYRDMDPDLAYMITYIAIPSGIIGSRIFHILDHLDHFIIDPIGMIFSTSGASALGGFILAFVVSIIFLKKRNVPILPVFDAASPSMALGYCFGRFGCHASGDGCYGLTSFSFLSVTYPNGMSPTSIPVLPTPLFEVLFSFLSLGILLNMRKTELPTGGLFFTFLILSGLPRFLVEFIRLNPKILFNLTQAQFVGIIFILTGIAGWIYSYKKIEE